MADDFVQKPKRPGPVTAVAVLFFIFGGLGLLGSLCGLTVATVLASIISNPPPPAPGQPNFVELWPMFDRHAPSFKYYIFIAMGIGAIMCLVEVIAGFGLLKMRYWGRRLGIFYAVVEIIIAIAAAAYSMTTLNPAMKAWQEDVTKWAQKEAQKAAKAGGGPGAAAPAPPPPGFASNPFLDAAGSVVGMAVSLIYPIIILILLMMPKVGKAFAIANGDAQPDEPEDYYDRRRDEDFDRIDRPRSVEPPAPPEDEFRYRARDE